MKSLLIYFGVTMYCANYFPAQQIPAGISPEKFQTYYDPKGKGEMTTPSDMEQFSPTPAPNISIRQISDTFYVGKGEYKEQMTFPFQNFQNEPFEERDIELPLRGNCSKQYIKCLMGQTAPTPVCAYTSAQNNYYVGNHGYFTGNSYCDVYFDNCRMGFRVWRIISYGKCDFVYGTAQDDVIKARRMEGGKLTTRNLLISKIINSLKKNKKPTQSDVV